MEEAIEFKYLGIVPFGYRSMTKNRGDYGGSEEHKK